MAKSQGNGEAQQEAIAITLVRADLIYPNPWNVNEMTSEMFEKEVQSIKDYGFVIPILVRPHPWERDGAVQIVDGENRWHAGRQLGMTEFPCVIREMDEETAQELGIILNETRGEPVKDKLAALVKSLAERRDVQELRAVMPFSRERFDEMVLNRQASQVVDYGKLEASAKTGNKAVSMYVERVFRMPREAAGVLDEAIASILEREQLDQDWQALEVMAAEAMAS